MNIPVLNKEANLMRAPQWRDIPMCLVMFVATRGTLIGFYPFGFALFCACFDKSVAYLGITVMYLSLISTGATLVAVKYIIASLCFLLFERFFSEKTEKYGSIVCALTMLVSGLIELISKQSGLYGAVAALCEGIAVYVMYEVFKRAYTFSKNINTEPKRDELISCAITVGVLIMGVGGVTLPYNIAPSRILSVYILLLCALSLNTSSAAAMGITIGFICGINNGAIMLSGVLGLGSVFASVLKGFKKIGITLGFIGGFGVSLLYIADVATLPLSVWDVLIGGAFFMLTPQKLYTKITEMFSPRVYTLKDVDKRAVNYMKGRIKNCSTAFKSLKEVFVNATQKRIDIYNYEAGELFDDVAARCCVMCPSYTRCFECEFNKTYNMFLEMLDKIENKGTLNINNLPLSFQDKCARLNEVVREFSHAYELHKNKLVHIDEMKTSRELSAMQYGEISDILDKIILDMDEGFVCCPELELYCANELMENNIKVKQIDIIENRYGKYEILLHTDGKVDMNIAEKLISSALNTNVGVEEVLSESFYRLVSKPKYSVDIGVMQQAKERECGDCVSLFTTDDHKLYCIISDGMGCGKKAKAESDITITLLREFISAGFSVKTAISIINSSMCLKADRETFSTIDLAEIDLITGVMESYKIGSAISLVYNCGDVSSIYSISLPAGMLPRLQIRAQTKKLEDGNILLMVSDGITEAGEIRTDWLKNQIKTPYASMQQLSEAVVKEAIHKSGEQVLDDMSVIAVMLKEI
ncbi:MAG: SpoIIE family protein phosphatase [Clostridia bacterium]|nr:SpoIIE family protein phosphatase [Clostridia bacterium]